MHSDVTEDVDVLPKTILHRPSRRDAIREIVMSSERTVVRHRVLSFSLQILHFSLPRPQSDLLFVEWDVKLYSVSITIYTETGDVEYSLTLLLTFVQSVRQRNVSRQ